MLILVRSAIYGVLLLGAALSFGAYKYLEAQKGKS
jgi:hypothetical protein